MWASPWAALQPPPAGRVALSCPGSQGAESCDPGVAVAAAGARDHPYRNSSFPELLNVILLSFSMFKEVVLSKPREQSHSQTLSIRRATGYSHGTVHRLCEAEPGQIPTSWHQGRVAQPDQVW